MPWPGRRLAPGQMYAVTRYDVLPDESWTPGQSWQDAVCEEIGYAEEGGVHYPSEELAAMAAVIDSLRGCVGDLVVEVSRVSDSVTLMADRLRAWRETHERARQ